MALVNVGEACPEIRVVQTSGQAQHSSLRLAVLLCSSGLLSFNAWLALPNLSLANRGFARLRMVPKVVQNEGKSLAFPPPNGYRGPSTRETPPFECLERHNGNACAKKAQAVEMQSFPKLLCRAIDGCPPHTW